MDYCRYTRIRRYWGVINSNIFISNHTWKYLDDFLLTIELPGYLALDCNGSSTIIYKVIERKNLRYSVGDIPMRENKGFMIRRLFH